MLGSVALIAALVACGSETGPVASVPTVLAATVRPGAPVVVSPVVASLPGPDAVRLRPARPAVTVAAAPTTAAVPGAAAPVRLLGVTDVAHRAVVGGRERTWQVHLPVGGAYGRPLVVVLHGRDGSGAGMRAVGLEAVAARDRIALAYLEAVDGSWNDGRTDVDSVAHRERVDDVAFVRRVVAHAVEQYGIDPDRVAAVGFSNGAMMVTRLACETSGLLRAGVSVGGVAAADQFDRCRPERVVPMQFVVSRADPAVPFAGGEIGGSAGKRRGRGAPAMAAASWWAARAGCVSSVSSPVPGAEPVVERWAATGCRGDGDVVVDQLSMAGHGWFEQRGYSATSATWAFLGRHGIVAG